MFEEFFALRGGDVGDLRVADAEFGCVVQDWVDVQGGVDWFAGC